MNSKRTSFYIAAVLAIVFVAASMPRAAFAGGDSSSMDPSVDVTPSSTATPGNSTAPSATQTPGNSSAPSASQTPGNSTAPSGTQTPGNSQAPSPTYTPGSGSNGSTFYLQNPLSDKFSSVGGLVEGFLEILSYIAVLLAVLMLIWTGLQFVMAQGEPKRLNELKTQLLWIVIGVALVIGARIIVTVAVQTLKSTNVVSDQTFKSANNALQGGNP